MQKSLPIYLILGLSFIGLFFLQPIPQSIDYHQFSDQRAIWGINNFWNVLSNLPFIIIGAWGLIKSTRNNAPLAIKLFFVGILLVGPGSAYYHYNPNSSTLIWDRLPMTIAFTSFFIWICSVFVSDQFKKWLFPALLIGITSVAYWAWMDDLRFYGWVQFSPMLIVIVFLLFYKSGTNVKKYILGVIGCYVIAKVFESYDFQVFEFSGSFMSGHAIKHVFSAMAPLFAGAYFTQKHAISPS